VHEALDRAALDAVKGLSFEPGKQQGEAVKVKMALPVTFKLGDDAPKEDNASVFEKAGMQQITVALQPDGPLTVDGQPSRMSDLSDVVNRKLATTDAKAFVALKVSGDVPMERVNQVQAALRAANAERISYSSQ
jgi:biopolymer transport protein ExbD